MSKNTRNAETALRMCRSWRGHDFDVVNGASSSVGAYAKNVTTRAARRLDVALEREALDLIEAEWQEYLSLSASDEERLEYEEANAFYCVNVGLDDTL
jgi:hypothetical protein